MKRNDFPSKDELEQFYIKELHTINECAEHFGIGKNKVYRCLKNYGLVRTQEDKSKVYSRVQTDPKTQEIIKNTNLKKYGFINKAQFNSPIRFLNDNEFSVHDITYTKEWLIEKYVTNNLPSNDMMDLLGISYVQLRRICRRYGVAKDSAKKHEIIRNRIFEKYGVHNISDIPGIQSKIAETNIKKYGASCCLGNHEIYQKGRNTCKNKYGVENERQKDILHFEVWNSDDAFISFVKSFIQQPLTIHQLVEYFNLEKTSILNRIHSLHLEQFLTLHPQRSHYEDEIALFLRQDLGIQNITLNDKDTLKKYEIDIYLPDYQLGIEFNGDYWHCDLWERYQDHNGRSLTHQQKSLFAEQQGIFLFHIFEHEWTNPQIQQNIKSRLKTLLLRNQIKIPARKCQIIPLTKEQKKEFLDINHIQGNDHASMQYGLIYNNEIVSCMTFIRPKNSKYTWELSRFCNKHDYNVQGGASKLFHYFVKTLKVGDTVSSYNDITKTKGTLYSILGFKCVSINQPNYIWINFKTNDIRSRYQEQAGGERERMHNSGYHRVCDCGTKTWVYTVQ